MEVNHKMINSSINGVARHDPFEDEEEEEEDFIRKVGIGRSYDCVFCRRGFTTAQALGGHMNVHRRDRATKNHNPTNPKSSSSSSSSYDYAKPPNLHELSSRGYNLSPPSRRSTMFFDVMSLGPQSGGGDGGGVEVRRSSQGGGEKGKEDLDLELRLGYYPYW